MKKLFRVLFAFTTGLLCSACIFPSSQPSEAIIAPDAVETIGSGYKMFAPDADIKVFMVETPSGKWNVRANVPLVKVTDETVETLSSSLILCDMNGTRLNDSFEMPGQDLAALLPVLNDAEKPARSISYMGAAEVDRKTAKAIIDGTASARLVLEATVAAPKPQARTVVKAQFPSDPTVESLVAYYGAWGILGQYEAAYRRGSKDDCKKVKARLMKIEDEIRQHPNGGRKIGNAFEDWYDDRIDEIEKKVDKGKKR